jgi:hypothetical protein
MISGQQQSVTAVAQPRFSIALHLHVRSALPGALHRLGQCPSHSAHRSFRSVRSARLSHPSPERRTGVLVISANDALSFTTAPRLIAMAQPVITLRAYQHGDEEAIKELIRRYASVSRLYQHCSRYPTCG